MLSHIKNNKILVGLITTIIGLLISWGVWATTSIFRQEGKQSVGMERDGAMQHSVEEIKGDIKDFKQDVKEGFADIRQKMDKNQEKVIDLLMDMKGDK